MLTVFISLATFMEVLDMTIVNVSIPAIAGTLGVSPNEGTWSITSYALAAAIMQPLTGWLGRRFGEVRTFVTSTLLFVVFSALCGFATTMPMLVVGRLLQGAVSGPMVPMAQALLMGNYPIARRGVAMAIWGMVVIVAPICGPLIGGWTTDNLSWRWLFYINVPIGLLGAFVCYTILRKRETRRVKVPVDVVGLVLLVIGVGALQFMLDNGNDKAWFASPLIVTSGVLAVICLTVLVAWELTDRHPVLDLHLFKHRNFSVGVATTCLGFASFFGIVVVHPIWLQTTVGYNSTWAGYAIAPVGVFGLLLMPFVGKYINRINLRLLVSFGFAVLATVMFMMSRLNADASFIQHAIPRLIQGIGLACFFLPLQQILFSDVNSSELASASGLGNFLRNLSGSISTAVSVWLWSERSEYHYATLVDQLQDDASWRHWSDALTQAGASDAGTLAYTESVLARQAQTLAINDIALLFGVVLLLLVPVLWLARPPFSGQGATTGH